VASQLQLDSQDSRALWPGLAQRLGGENGVIAGFVACYLPLVWLGYAFKADELQLSVMWPAVGLLLAALYIAPLRHWPLIIALQLACEYTVGLVMREPSLPWGLVAFMLANSTDAVVGALVARWRLRRIHMERATQVLQFLLATAIGAAASATLGAAIAVFSYGAVSYTFQWQLWWVGNGLGALVVAPVVIFWSLPGARPYRVLRLRNRWEIPAFAVALAASTWWLFAGPQSGADSLLRTPAALLALLLAAAFRLPPRWSSLLALGTVMLAAALGAHGRNPFFAADPYMQILILQAYLALLACVTLIVSILVAAMRIALELVSSSESRYRSFITLSSEAVWRVEIEPPMPVTLSPDAQRQWLRDHAHVAEGNAVFEQMAAACTEPHGDHGPKWLAERSWCALYEGHLEQAARNGYALDGQRLSAHIAGRARTFITTFSGVVSDGQLQRVWCVARDVSEIVDLNTRLLRERERLRAYAHQLVTAEERARRATAVDLHDGIGQSLTGMAMSLEVARMQAPQIGALLDDVRVNLRKVQEHTRGMIADLSPPGLYELGLAPALQWLAVHFRSQEKLRVQLTCNVIEDSINMELRVLVFKLVRELLRNVVKHAGVESATVRVLGDRTRVSVEVQDEGRGFEWQIEMFGSRPGGFGLWSISDRVGGVGGELTVDTAPGRGAHFKLVFPL
jgi:signal transduction histidine kinase